MTMVSPGPFGTAPTPARAEEPVVLTGQHHEPPLPTPRGPVSQLLLDHLCLPVHELPPLPEAEDDPVEGDDSALALHLLYELHYRGFEGVDEAWEWEPTVLRERRRLERRFEARIGELAGGFPIGLSADATREALLELAEDDAGPSLSTFLAERGSLEQLREVMIHRSASQLREADAHTWGIPRLAGRAKAAMVEIQMGEYGGGRAEDVHAEMFGAALEELGLDRRYGAYVDRLPGVTLSTGNLISLFGLHRRWRGALVGHLALFEMTSVGPMGRYHDALQRLGRGGGAAARFFEAHVEADAHHGVVGLEDLVGGLLEDEPILAGEVVFGAAALDAVEARFSAHVRGAFEAGRSSLRPA